jgi:hypothetical protein
MNRARADRIDRVARRFAGAGRAPVEVPTPDDAVLSRRALLRYGALGVLAVSLRGVPSARAMTAGAAAGCRGGSLAACYRETQKAYKKILLTFCDKPYNDTNDPFGMSRYECWVNWTYTRFQVRKECRSNCPKPKKKPKKQPGGGGGGGTPPPGGGPTPTCGQVDCVAGDLCCQSDSGPICCAICCSKNGGCGSSDSDCK